MRIIRVDDDGADSKTMIWVAAGAAVGLVAGALIAERLSGRKVSGRMLWRRVRGLSSMAASRWEPLLGTAMALRDAWAGREDLDADDEADDAADDELDESLEATADYAEDGDDETDAAIDSRVLEAFANDPVLAERSVEIEEQDEGRIVLHGRVHTAREVAHAVTIARGVPGVASVKQRLTVRDRR